MISGSIFKQISEIRSHYSHEIRDSTLFIGFNLKNSQRQYALPFDKIPVPGAMRWLLFGGPARGKVTSTFVIDTIRGVENIANRQLTQQEAEGYALHASRRMVYSFSSTISAVGIGAGLSLWGRRDMKFPFRKPQPPEKYNNFPNRWLPILTGQYARIMWHITRANVYITLTFLLLSPLNSAMGDTAMMVGLYQDPRTKDLALQIKDQLFKTKGKIQRHDSNRPRPGKEVPSARPPAASTRSQNGDGPYAYSDQGPTNIYGDRDDYSGDTAYEDSIDPSPIGDSQFQRPDTQQSSPSFLGKRWPVQGNPTPPSTKDSGSLSDSDYFSDDASPTAGNDPDMAAGGIYGENGSAWERIRKGQAPSQNKRGVQPPGVRQQKQGPTARQLQQKSAMAEYEPKGDSFSFSSTDEEKKLAKEQAQKEFDEMVERERKGTANDEDAVGGGAWRRRRE